MTTMMSASDLVRQAISYVFEMHKENPERSYDTLLDEAAMRFNLSPLDCEALRHAICQRDKDGV